MNKSTNIDLIEIAYRAMKDRNLLYEFSEEALQQARSLEEKKEVTAKDERNLFWISIDNDDSLDLDQLTYAEIEQGQTIFYVAIADVDALVAKNTPIDQHALYNTTSVYTAPKNFPMLPVRLSTNLTSLNPDVDRLAVIVKMLVDADGAFQLVDLYTAWVKNRAKLTYNKVSTSLANKAEYGPQIMQQLILQDQIAKKIKAFRNQKGALHFKTVEVRPVINKDQQVVAIEPVVFNRAHALIENFMIAANVSISRYMKAKSLPLMQRVVKEPTNWDKIVAYAKKFEYELPQFPDNLALQQFLQRQQKQSPETFEEVSLSIIKLIGRGEYVALQPNQTGFGHFDLAQEDYAHTTAPNRRFPDLIMQRILKAYLFSRPLPYSYDELNTLAVHCTIREDDATKVERRVQKSVIALFLIDQIGKEFHAIVTGASEKGTWVKIKEPPVEGKLVKGYQNCNVGDKIQVKLMDVDVGSGFIDFARVT